MGKTVRMAGKRYMHCRKCLALENLFNTDRHWLTIHSRVSGSFSWFKKEG